MMLMARIVAQHDADRESLGDRRGSSRGHGAAYGPRLAKELDVRHTIGFVVVNVEGTGPTEAILQPKDVVLEVRPR